jgi:hypothetical protein
MIRTNSRGNAVSGYNDGERVRVVVPFRSERGLEYEVGWEGIVTGFHRTLHESRQTARYEVAFDDGPGRQNRGLVQVQDNYFERIGDRKPGELRQGDRVYLKSDIEVLGKLYQEDTPGTVLSTHEPPEGCFHYVAVDWGENIQVPRGILELMGDPPAKVMFSIDGTLRISLSD